MIPYHGTPLGGVQLYRPKFLQGRHALVSFADLEDLQIVAECCKTFVIDNGAFTAWKSGNPVKDWKPYYEFCKQWLRHPGCDWCIIPDIIDGDEAANDQAIVEFVNWKGWLGARWHLNAKAVPVWHLHESLDRLKRLANAWTRIAFGSSGEFAEIGGERWAARMHEAFSSICIDGQPICKVHGLRMMDPAVFHRFPFSSVDSTNVAQNKSREEKGHKVNAVIAREIIAARIECHNSADTYETPDQKQTMIFK